MALTVLYVYLAPTVFYMCLALIALGSGLDVGWVRPKLRQHCAELRQRCRTQTPFKPNTGVPRSQETASFPWATVGP